MSQVTITRSESLMSMKQSLGATGVKLAECVNKSTGESFKSLAFVGGDGKVVRFAHFGASIPASQQNAKWLRDNAMNITIGENSNGNYSAYINKGWESIL